MPLLIFDILVLSTRVRLWTCDAEDASSIFKSIAKAVSVSYNQSARNDILVLKNFDDLTIADDFMFCKIMQDTRFSKRLIEMILSDTIGKISYISVQHSIKTYQEAKSVRFDIVVQTENGTFYDIEMQVRNEHNIPKRMRFYQSALDIAFLDKGNSYNRLNDSFIIFICLFDVFGQERPIYTFENRCTEDTTIVLKDGTTKIVINAEAFSKAENEALKDFLEYVKTGKVKNTFTQEIEAMIQTIKSNEQARQEYRLLSTFEMDAIDRGIQQGFSDGVRQTAKLLKQLGDPTQKIAQVTGLSQEEIAAL